MPPVGGERDKGTEGRFTRNMMDMGHNETSRKTDCLKRLAPWGGDQLHSPLLDGSWAVDKPPLCPPNRFQPICLMTFETIITDFRRF